MEQDPALEAHEQIEHAEHAAHTRDPYITRVSLTIAILAVLAAGVSTLETLESNRTIIESSKAVLAQDQATDAWNEYQADSLKRHMYDIAGENGPAHFRKDSQDARTAQDKVRAEAVGAEKERDAHVAASALHEERHHWLAAATVLAEIGIALSTVAMISKQRAFWFSAIGLGVVGAGLFATAYLI